MKIVHCIFAFNTGGSETMLVDIVNEQCNYADVSVIIINKNYEQALVAQINKRINVVCINRKESSKSIIPIFKINYVLSQIKPNVIHCHNHNIIPLLLPIFRKSTVLTLHDVGIEIKYLNLYNKLFAISDIVKDDIRKRAGLDAIRIYNGIHPEKIQVKEDYSSTERFRIIQVSRLNHLKKGQHIAIEALKILKDKGIENIHLDFIGEGESEQFLKELVSNYALENQILFKGNKSRDYIYVTLKDYDLLIQPSIYEGFGLTVAEGMAAKIPVLVSDNEGPMEVINRGQFGYYFELGKAISLAIMIEKVMCDYKTHNIQTLVDRAYVRVVEEFDIKNSGLNYINNY